MKFFRSLLKIKSIFILNYYPLNLIIISNIFIVTILIISSEKNVFAQDDRIPIFENIKKEFYSSEIVLLDRNNIFLKKVRNDFSSYRLNWVRLEDISTDFIKILLFSEDKNYYSHTGVAWFSLLAATWSQIGGNTKRGGASTISMQLVKLLEANQLKRSLNIIKNNNNIKSHQGFLQIPITRKIKDKIEQIKYARNLEKIWNKKEILEAYINLISFRGELQGVASAAHKFFNKSAKDISVDEAILLSILIRSPNAKEEIVYKRFCTLRNELKDYDYEMWFKSSECQKISDWIKNVFHNPTKTYASTILPALGEQGNFLLDISKVSDIISPKLTKIKTTIDIKIQKIAMKLAQAQIRNLKERNVNDAAVVVIDNFSGDILAYVANIGNNSSASHIDGALAKRQAGSSLKPFLYALILEQKILTADSILDDSPISIPVTTGDYNPQNYDKMFVGKVPLRVALGSSLNVPAVRVLQLIGTNTFLATLRNLGFSDLQRDDYYGPSLALGAIDISLLELANAYRSLANNGKWRPVSILYSNKNDNVQDKKQFKKIYSKKTTDTISEILSNKDNRVLTFGLDSVLNTEGSFAVKTGTSKDMRDNWCIGYSKEYTVGVWVGNMNGMPMWNVSGVVGAAPIYSAIMNELNDQHYLSNRLTRKNLITDRKININVNNKDNDNLLTLKILFPKIIYPTDKMVVALDQDIPLEWQYLFFEAKDTLFDKNVWLLDGEIISKGNEKIKWKIKRGTYKLALATNKLHIVDEISFTVK